MPKSNLQVEDAYERIVTAGEAFKTAQEKHYGQTLDPHQKLFTSFKKEVLDVLLELSPDDKALVEGDKPAKLSSKAKEVSAEDFKAGKI